MHRLRISIDWMVGPVRSYIRLPVTILLPLDSRMPQESEPATELSASGSEEVTEALGTQRVVTGKAGRNASQRDRVDEQPCRFIALAAKGTRPGRCRVFVGCAHTSAPRGGAPSQVEGWEGAPL
jgi:hypothetical protein